MRLGRRATTLRAPLVPTHTVRVRLRGCGGRLRIGTDATRLRTVTAVRSMQTLSVAVPSGRPVSAVRFARAAAARARQNGRARRACARVSVDRVDVAAPPVPLGAAVRDDALASDAPYRSALASDFRSATPENELKMEAVHPQPDIYSFERADGIVGFARSRGLAVRGHTLLWGEQLPRWVTSPVMPWTRSSLREVLRRHVTTVVGHFRGRIDTWDVANEVVRADGSRSSTIWQRTIGDDDLDVAFRAARAADPGARLVLNDNGIERAGAHQDGVVRLVRDLRARGVPVDGIGIQAHLDPGSGVTASDLDRTMSRFAALGVRVEITEADVPRSPPLTPAATVAQAETFAQAADACWQHAACDRFTVWGVTDAHSWRGADTGAVLVDGTGHPKPAYAAVRAALAGRS